jgi:hypothetical protein
MGLFKTKKEVMRDNPHSLPEPSIREDGFLNQSDLPDVPPGLPKDLQEKTLPDLPNPSVPKIINESTGPFLAAQQRQSPYPMQNNFGFDQPKNNSSETYPFAEPLRRKEIQEIAEPPRIKEIDSNYEPQLQFDPKPRAEAQKSYRPDAKKAEPVFIRLDKFETTIEAFEEIKGKIIEIEDLLKKIKEVKTKEEEELVNWEKDIQIIKGRIDSIDKNIFSKLD